MKPTSTKHRLKAQGLYHPSMEHDACGVGFVVDIIGTKRHDIIHKAIEVLNNLEHRGACGCDPLTGDGAGLLIQVPHEFFQKITPGLKIKLPVEGDYGVGMVFLPPEVNTRNEYEVLFERMVHEEGQSVLGWRDVPIYNEHVGKVALEVEPVIRQIFIAKAKDIKDTAAFERKLYVIRKRVENTVLEEKPKGHEYFHVPSLSTRTIVYKG